MPNSSQWQVMERRTIPCSEECHKKSFGQWLHKVKISLLQNLAYNCPSNGLRVRLHRWRGVHIGKDVYIGQRCSIDNLFPEYVYLEDGANLHMGTTVLTHYAARRRASVLFKSFVAPVVVRKGALVSVNATLMPGVEIGEDAVVSAGSVVEKDVAPMTVVKGVPAIQVSDFSKLKRLLK